MAHIGQKLAFGAVRGFGRRLGQFQLSRPRLLQRMVVQLLPVHLVHIAAHQRHEKRKRQTERGKSVGLSPAYQETLESNRPEKEDNMKRQ